MKKYRSLILIAWLFLVLTIPLGGSDRPELSPSLLGYLRVENPERMIRDLETFLGAVDLPFPVGGIIRMGLGELIANPGLSGVDLSAPLILAGFRTERPDAWAVSLALPAPEAYSRTLARNWEVKFRSKAEGIRVYSRETREFDAEAFQDATPEERIAVDSFYRSEEKTLAVAAAEKRAWISLDPEVVREVASLTPADFPVPVEGALAVSLRIPPLLEIAGESREELPESPALDGPASASPFGPRVGRELNRVYLELLLDYGRQIENFFFGLTLDGSGLKLEEVFQARPGSPLADFLAAQKPGKLSLARFLEPSPWLAGAGRIEQPEMLLEVYRRFFGVFPEMMAEIGESGAGGEAAGRLTGIWESRLSLIEDYFHRVAGEELAFSISSPPGSFISMVSIQEIRDREAWRDYVRKSFLENRDFLFPFYEALGVTLDVSGVENPETYRGTEIFTARMNFDFDRISRAGPVTEDAKKLPALIKDPLVIRLAAAESLAVTEFSWGGEPDLRGRLDRIAAGKSSFDTARLGPRWEEANGVIYFSLNRYLQDFLAPLLDNMESGEETGIDRGYLNALGGIDLPMIIYLTINNRELKAAAEIPVGRIRAVKAAVEALEAGE